MLGVDPGMWVDLEGVIVVGGIFEQTVKWIKHFVGKQEEKFSVLCQHVLDLIITM